MTDAVQQAAERIRFAEKNTRLRALLIDLLEAPFLGGTAVALSRTNACYELDHQAVRADGGCACGKVVQP